MVTIFSNNICHLIELLQWVWEFRWNLIFSLTQFDAKLRVKVNCVYVYIFMCIMLTLSLSHFMCELHNFSTYWTVQEYLTFSVWENDPRVTSRWLKIHCEQCTKHCRMSSPCFLENYNNNFVSVQFVINVKILVYVRCSLKFYAKKHIYPKRYITVYKNIQKCAPGIYWPLNQ